MLNTYLQQHLEKNLKLLGVGIHRIKPNKPVQSEEPMKPIVTGEQIQNQKVDIEEFLKLLRKKGEPISKDIQIVESKPIKT